MFKKISVFGLMLIMSAFLTGSVRLNAQSNEDYSNAIAVIKSIESRGSVGKRYVFATVSFNTAEGKEIITQVELVKIPFFKTFSKTGDQIEISYNKKSPFIAFTKTGNFLNQYGLYILIVLGIIFSALAMFRARRKQTSGNG
jgi:hypothetical protein